MTKLEPYFPMLSNISPIDYLYNRFNSPNIPLNPALINPLDTALFSTVFMKCTNTVNSTRKVTPNTSGIRQVMKGTIGYIDDGQANARYADRKNAYQILHPEHVKLANKADKRAMINDFLQVKENALVRFHNLKVLASQFVGDQVEISEVFQISARSLSSTLYGSPPTIGYLDITKKIYKSDVTFSVFHRSGIFDDYTKTINNSFRRENSLVIKAQIQWNSEIKPLFSLLINGRGSVERFNCDFSTYGLVFDGIDVAGLANQMALAYDKITALFLSELEAVKEKYFSDFLLSEICENKNCAI